MDELLDRIKKLGDAMDVLRVEREETRDEIVKAQIDDALLLMHARIQNAAYRIIEGGESL